MIGVNPKIKKFICLAKNHNLLVLSAKFYSDWLTPLSIYYQLAKSTKGESFLLESVEGHQKVCRFSFLGFSPLCVFKSKGRKIYINNGKLKYFRTSDNPLGELKQVMSQFKVAPLENLRFFGGFVGYAAYDLVRFYEPIGGPKDDPLDTFDTYFILPSFLIIFDHQRHQIEILSFLKLDNKKKIKQVYLKAKTKTEQIYKKIITPCQLPELDFAPSRLKVNSNFKKKDFLEAVRKAKRYIRKGDIIQVVLSQRFSAEFRGNPFSAYRYLRVLNPSPYMFYLDFKGLKVCGASPEMLIRCENGVLTTRPIAGTRRRGKDEKEDKTLRKDLLADPKEKAEHIMLVDLARNDLGRVAQKATVNLPVFMEVEKFSHVMHIVSEVRAELDKKEDIFSSLISCFPAGTVSGAPKVRAMQIINELEKDARGIYAGSVGYFSFTKSLDTGIIIRTIVFKQSKAYIQAGAGIVADSKPENEYRETVDKAKAQILALKLAKEAL